MISGPIALPATTVPPRVDDGRGRVVELLLVGGATLLLLPLSWWVRHRFGLDEPEYAIGFLTFYGAFVVNDPHFAVTYVLFYRDARRRALGREVALAQRVRYVLAGVVAPVALVVWAIAAIALRSAQALGWMIQLMFLLVGWHYAKQAFGVFTVLCARHGARVTPLERNAFLAHSYAAWAFAWANPAMPAGEFEEKGVVYTALAHPRGLEIVAGVVLALSAVALVAVLGTKWRRERRLFPIAPLAGFLITLWSWTIYSSVDPLLRYVIPALHSIQYLYFVWLMTRNQARAEEGPPFFGRPRGVRLAGLAASALALGWLFFHGAPAFFDGMLVSSARGGSVTTALGDTPFFAAFFVVVSIHHYVMDAVIWRRDNPDTRYLRDPIAPGADVSAAEALSSGG